MGGASPIGALFLAHLPKHPKRSGFHPWFDDVWQIFVLVALGMHARILALRHSKCFANMCDPRLAEHIVRPASIRLLSK